MYCVVAQQIAMCKGGWQYTHTKFLSENDRSVSVAVALQFGLSGNSINSTTNVSDNKTVIYLVWLDSTQLLHIHNAFQKVGITFIS